jgi:hypothetical protein
MAFYIAIPVVLSLSFASLTIFAPSAVDLDVATID